MSILAYDLTGLVLLERTEIQFGFVDFSGGSSEPRHEIESEGLYVEGSTIEWESDADVKKPKRNFRIF